jgi:hypothetical protein
MLRGVALVRADGSEERIASIIRVTTIGAIGKLALKNNRSSVRRNIIYTINYIFFRNVFRLVVIANFFTSYPILVTLMVEAILSSETLRNVPEDDILHCVCLFRLRCAASR